MLWPLPVVSQRARISTQPQLLPQWLLEPCLLVRCLLVRCLLVRCLLVRWEPATVFRRDTSQACQPLKAECSIPTGMMGI